MGLVLSAALAILSTAQGIVTIALGIVGIALAYLQLRIASKKRWRKYQLRGIPYGRIFRGKEYGYDPKTFLADVGSLDRNFKTLQDWHAGRTKPLLVKGVTGVGKSRLVTQFLGQLGFWERLTKRVLMPTVEDMREKIPPRRARNCILFLNDLHEYRDPTVDSKLIELFQDNKFKIIATIPDEKYDPNWEVLYSYRWEEMKVEQWTEREGKRLAGIMKITFDRAGFRGTPLSVITPTAEIKRRFDLLPSDRKAVLESLKIIKTHLGCYASYELASALTVPSGKFDEGAFVDVTSIQRFWCKVDDSAAILADGVDESIRYDVTIGDAYGLQAVLMRDEKPVKGREMYLFYLGHCFSQLREYGRSLKCYDRSKELDPSNPTPWFNRARTLIALGRIEDAQDSLRQAKKLFRKLGNRLGMAIALHELGTIAMNTRVYPDAIKLYDESLKISQAIDFQLQVSFSLHHLGMVNQRLHRYPQAREFYKRSLEIKRKLGARPETAVSLANLAAIELDESNLDEAKSLYEEALGILKESGDLVGIANALSQLSKIEYRKNNLPEAKRLHDQSMLIWRGLGMATGN